jgi:hypothetical protein
MPGDMTESAIYVGSRFWGSAALEPLRTENLERGTTFRLYWRPELPLIPTAVRI